MKKQLKQKEQKLAEANKQTKLLDNTSQEVAQLLDNLKPMPFNKNNSQISNENIAIIKNYIEDVSNRTTLINFKKYKIVMFAMAKLMEMETTEQNKVELYLFNNI